VIESFVGSWDLFGSTYLVGLLIAGVLSVVGVWIVARDHIFLGAAVAQASTLGVALALWLSGTAAATRLHILEGELGATLFAVAASVTTAWVAARVGEGRTESHEAVIGWIFLLAGSLPVLLLARSPHGLEEVQRLLFSTILSVTGADLVLFVTLALATLAATVLLRDRLLVFTLDPELAQTIGMRASVWGGAVALWLGLAVGLSIRAAGTLFAFGCLVLPALVAKNVCREVRPMLWVAPCIAVATTLTGFVLSNGLDWPPAHTIVMLQSAAVPVAWVWRRTRRH